MGSEAAGEWLTRQMDRQGVSVAQVASALDVTTKTVYYWRGNKTDVSEERVPRLAEVLGISELEARRGLGFWVPADEAAAYDIGYEIGRGMDDETLTRLLQSVDNRALLDEIARRMDHRE